MTLLDTSRVLPQVPSAHPFIPVVIMMPLRHKCNLTAPPLAELSLTFSHGVLCCCYLAVCGTHSAVPLPVRAWVCNGQPWAMGAGDSEQTFLFSFEQKMLTLALSFFRRSLTGSSPGAHNREQVDTVAWAVCPSFLPPVTLVPTVLLYLGLASNVTTQMQTFAQA